MSSPDKSDIRYISELLSHFVGRNQSTDQDKFILLKKIMQEGRLIHPPTQKRITSNDGVDTVATTESRNGELIGRLIVEINPGEDPHIEVDAAISLDLTESYSNNNMIKPQMICFCDIPFEHQSIHMYKYSKFGLSFSKEFLMHQGVSPVFYIANESRLKGSTQATKDELEVEYKQLNSELTLLVQSGKMTRSEGFIANTDIFKNYISKKAQSTISRAELFNEQVRDAIQSLDLISRQMLISGSSKDGQKLLSIKTFFIEQILAYIQCFDASLPEKHRDNFYMEREWRSLHSICFDLGDVKEIIIPSDFEISLQEYLNDKPQFTGAIRILPSTK